MAAAPWRVAIITVVPAVARGNVLVQTAVPIDDDETGESLQKKLSEVTPGLLAPVVPLGPLLERDGSHVRITKSSLVEVEGAERLECADGPVWILETQPL